MACDFLFLNAWLKSITQKASLVYHNHPLDFNYNLYIHQLQLSWDTTNQKSQISEAWNIMLHFKSKIRCTSFCKTVSKVFWSGRSWFENILKQNGFGIIDVHLFIHFWSQTPENEGPFLSFQRKQVNIVPLHFHSTSKRHLWYNIAHLIYIWRQFFLNFLKKSYITVSQWITIPFE